MREWSLPQPLWALNKRAGTMVRSRIEDGECTKRGRLQRRPKPREETPKEGGKS